MTAIGIGMTSERTRTRLIERLRASGIRNETVLSAIRKVPRHLFIEEALAHRAYEDTALPIGFGQTISQPYVVARMTEALIAGRGRLNRVLELGTGSGYQAAILSAVASEVYSIERINALYDRTRQLFQKLHIRNVQLRYGDGCKGWLEAAPFDGIILTAAGAEVPPLLLQQLSSEGGRLIAPIGDPVDQALHIITRQGDEWTTTTLESVRFVPLLEGKA